MNLQIKDEVLDKLVEMDKAQFDRLVQQLVAEVDMEFDRVSAETVTRLCWILDKTCWTPEDLVSDIQFIQDNWEKEFARKYSLQILLKQLSVLGYQDAVHLFESEEGSATL